MDFVIRNLLDSDVTHRAPESQAVLYLTSNYLTELMEYFIHQDIRLLLKKLCLVMDEGPSDRGQVPEVLADGYFRLNLGR